MNAVAAEVPAFETPSPWDEVTQVYRRVCLLRAQGRGAEASQYYAEKFSAALDVIEQFAGAGPDTELRVRSLLAAEDERIANAGALAALLAPLLLDRLQEIFSANFSPRTAGKSPAVSGNGAAAGFSPRDSAQGSVPSVADLIEGMLAQERAAAPRNAQRAS